MMSSMRIHVLHTGEVRVSPYLPFGGDHCSLLKASGFTTPKKDWIWLPVSCYLIEHPQGLILVDTGWHRDMSPHGVFDKKAQIKSLGSWFLYHVNQGRIAAGEAIDEAEVDRVVGWWRGRGGRPHNPLLVAAMEKADEGGCAGSEHVGVVPTGEDPLLWEAARIVVDSRDGSTPRLARALSVGYARAGRIMDMLEAKGVVGPANGPKPREVLVRRADAGGPSTRRVPTCFKGLDGALGGGLACALEGGRAAS